MTKAVPKARLIDIQQEGIPRTAQGVPIRPRQTWNIQSDVARELRRQEDTELHREEKRYDPSLTLTMSDRLYGFGDPEPNKFNNNDPIYRRMRMRHLKETEAASGYRDKLNAGANPRQENPTGVEFNNLLNTLQKDDKDQRGPINDVPAIGHSYLGDAQMPNFVPPMQHHTPAWHPAMPSMSMPSFTNAPAYVPVMSTPGPYPYSSYGCGMGSAHTFANNLPGMPFQGYDPQLVMQAQQVWNTATPEEHYKFLHKYYGGQNLHWTSTSATAPTMETGPSPASYHGMPYQTMSPQYGYPSPRYSSPTIPTWLAHAQHSHPPPTPSPPSLPYGLSEYKYGSQRSACESVCSNGSSLRYRTIVIPRSRRYQSGPSESSRRENATAQGQDCIYKDDDEGILPAKRKRCR